MCMHTHTPLRTKRILFFPVDARRYVGNEVMFLHSANEYKSFFCWLYKYQGFIINAVWVPVVVGGLRVRGLFSSSAIQLFSYCHSVKF